MSQESRCTEVTYAFRNELYHNQWRSVCGSSRMLAASKASKGSWMALYGDGRVGNRASRCRTVDFRHSSVSGHGPCPVGSGDPDGLGGGLAQDAPRFGAATERVPYRTAAIADAATGLAGGNRLASPAILWGAVQESQRDLPQQAEARDEEVSRLCLGLHRGVRATLYAGLDLGATPRNDGQGFATLVGANPQNRPENPLCSHGSGLLQRSGHAVPSRGKPAFPDARDVSRAAFQETAQSDRSACDSTEVGRLVQVHHEEPQATGDFSDLRWIPDQPQRRQTGTEKVVVRRLASERHTHGDSRTLPPAFRHRNELPPDASGKDLHLHTQSASAAVLSGRGADPAKYLGMASSNTLCRRLLRQPDDPPGTAAIQTHARMDRL